MGLTDVDRRFLADIRRTDSYEPHLVYLDALQERGDGSHDFVALLLVLDAIEPGHVHWHPIEKRLSTLRRELDADWVDTILPAFHAPLPDPCDCTQDDRPRLHRDLQDTESDAWHRVIDAMATHAGGTFSVYNALDKDVDAYRSLRTLPESIATLDATYVVLYGSKVVRIPDSIGANTVIRRFDPYTSYRLHWFPHTYTRTALTDSTISTRALYGNRKNNAPFPVLAPLRLPTLPAAIRSVLPPPIRACHICDDDYVDVGAHRAWHSRTVGTDRVPLLVQACSSECLTNLS